MGPKFFFLTRKKIHVQEKSGTSHGGWARPLSGIGVGKFQEAVLSSHSPFRQARIMCDTPTNRKTYTYAIER